ncbi:RNA polymerase sigma factor sigF, chloroplastic [Diospyros lotus]|uniref:RNA polymerase sigma factor sigF, chloroplastic n=1 Tax=Diospyros lotus TaxID=55363 RepID=UPI00225A85DA|nr:RNA polymerase sigma factor sigF, chloroplastic [Diospyros lotus]
MGLSILRQRKCQRLSPDSSLSFLLVYLQTNTNPHLHTSMEVGRNLLSSSSPLTARTHLRNCPSSSSSSSSSVLMLHEQAAHALPFMPTTSLAQHFPTSVLQEQRDETRPFMHMIKEDKMSQVTLSTMQMEGGSPRHKENSNMDSDQCLEHFQRRLLNLPGLWYLLPSFETKGMPSSTVPSTPGKENKLIEPHNVVALAKKALSASKQAALLAEDSELLADIDQSLNPRSTSFGNFPLEEKTVRSTRMLERRSKKRRVAKPRVTVEETSNSRKANLQRKKSVSFDPNDPLRLFLRGSETRQLLTAKEESELIAQIQDLMRLEEVKNKLHYQFNCEPTLVEWAAAVGLSCRDLKLQIHRGNSSREKLIYANFRMVVHIAKLYQGRGLNLQDLLQEGSRGLMRSVEKFKPQAGCRFASYAYWWIRQTIREAIFHHSRTIRLPENVYILLKKVTEAKRLCIQEGNHRPTKEQIAARAGITVEKLERLLFAARMPLSMQQPVWTDQDTTFQEVTADTAIETPEALVAKRLMRQHVRSLLSVLSPKERRIIRLRFGIVEGANPKSLSEIGSVFGLSKERVRQLESRALHKLKQSLSVHGLNAYADLVI